MAMDRDGTSGPMDQASFRLSPELKLRLRSNARRKGRTLSEHLRGASQLIAELDDVEAIAESLERLRGRQRR
jgi:predicted DNA-binding protein